MTNETELDDVAAATAAALLGGGAIVNAWSLMLGLAALLVLLLAAASWASAWFGVSVAAGLVQAYYALRCSIDAELFGRLGGGIERYQRLDASLAAWGLAESGQARSLEQRIQAALALSRRQRMFLYLQLVALAVGTALLLIVVD